MRKKKKKKKNLCKIYKWAYLQVFIIKKNYKYIKKKKI